MKILTQLALQFVDIGSRECYVGMLYACYDLIRLDVVMEISWRHGLTDFTMPFLINFMSQQATTVDALRRDNDERKAREASAQKEEDSTPILGGSRLMLTQGPAGAGARPPDAWCGVCAADEWDYAAGDGVSWVLKGESVCCGDCTSLRRECAGSGDRVSLGWLDEVVWTERMGRKRGAKFFGSTFSLFVCERIQSRYMMSSELDVQRGGVAMSLCNGISSV